MRLSKLQKYVLTSFYLNKSNFKVKQDFYNFFPAERFKKNSAKGGSPPDRSRPLRLAKRVGQVACDGGRGASGGKKTIQDIIHKSLENLVVKDLLVAYGRKTAQKWYIDKVKITSQGKRLALKLIKNRQRKLPIK